MPFVLLSVTFAPQVLLFTTIAAPIAARIMSAAPLSVTFAPPGIVLLKRKVGVFFTYIHAFPTFFRPLSVSTCAENHFFPALPRSRKAHRHLPPHGGNAAAARRQTAASDIKTDKSDLKTATSHLRTGKSGLSDKTAPSERAGQSEHSEKPGLKAATSSTQTHTAQSVHAKAYTQKGGFNAIRISVKASFSSSEVEQEGIEPSSKWGNHKFSTCLSPLNFSGIGKTGATKPTPYPLKISSLARGRRRLFPIFLRHLFRELRNKSFGVTSRPLTS